MEVHYASLKVLPKNPCLKPIESLGLAISLLEVKETEKHVEWPPGDAISKIQSVGNY